MKFFATVLGLIGHFFTGFFTSILGSDAAKTVEAGIVAFVKTDVGELAVDAVQYASTLADTTNDGLRAAAVTKLQADLKAAGKDAESLAESTLNLFVEMAYTYVKGTVAALPAAIAAK